MHADPEICHISYARLFWENLSHGDLHCQTGPEARNKWADIRNATHFWDAQM